MKRNVLWTIIVSGMCLGAYVQYTGFSVDGLPKVVQPYARAALATCTRGCGHAGSALAALPKVVQPHVCRAKAVCARGCGYVGATLAPLWHKLGLGYTWAREKSCVVSRAIVSRLKPRPAPFAAGSQAVGSGTITALLPDDFEGSRRQRFKLRLASGQTLLVIHNIDLSPRIDALKVGDTVTFSGIYGKDGVIRWTHADPLKRHVAGWLKHNGNIYQ